jgi:hypothetical protein
MDLEALADEIIKEAYGKRMNQRPKLPNLPMKAKKPHVNKHVKKFKFHKYHPKTKAPKTNTIKPLSAEIDDEIEALEQACE